LKEKILSRLDRIAYIRHEPLLLNPKVLQTAKTGNKYSQTCIKRSPWGQRKSVLIRQVSSEKRLILYEIVYDSTRKR